MACFQPYDDVPGIQTLDEYPYWASIDPSLEQICSQGDYNSTHTWNMKQHLMTLQHSVDGCGRLNPLLVPDEKFSQLGLQSPWDSRPDMYRHMRTVSPGCAFGVNSATDSNTSEEAFSPESTRQYPAFSHGPSVSHHTYHSHAAEGSFTIGNGSWMPHTLYSNAPPSSPYAPSDHSACNLKDLQYSHDEEVEEERPAAAEHQHPLLHLQPEEVAFADEGLGRSIGDEDSTKDSDDDLDPESPNSDVDSDYNPSQKRQHHHSSSFTSRAGRSFSRRTRSLQTSTTSPILPSTTSRITKPAHANHRRTSSSTLKPRNITPTGTKSTRLTKHFPCTFSHYGCPSTFQSKNEWKRHVSSQHLQLGFYRCDSGFCNPDASGGKAGGARSHNDFNRKDLFTQHHRRMHLPFAGKYEKASAEQREAFDASMEAVRERCWVVRREKPARSVCGFVGCGAVFEGENAWEERMEHVGKHFERGDSDGEVMEDGELTLWAVQEGLVRDLGARGRWLVGMEPGLMGGNEGKRTGRGRRAAAAVREEDDHEEEEDDEE